MKQRILSAVIGIALLLVVLGLFETIVLNLAAALMIAVAAFEITRAVDPEQPAFSRWLSIGFACLVPFSGRSMLLLLVFVYAVLTLACAVRRYPQVHVASVGLQIMMVTGVSGAFYCFLLIREYASSTLLALYYLILVCGSAWLSDAGAYFIGCRFGKRKLCPAVSPKKSVEGFWGGLASGVLGNLLISFIFMQLQKGALAGYAGAGFDINYLYVALVSPLLSLLGVLGDLSASMVKRSCGIKDYGSIMPGHGGVMDRFDSVLFIVPLVYLIMRCFPLAA